MGLQLQGKILGKSDFMELTITWDKLYETSLITNLRMEAQMIEWVKKDQMVLGLNPPCIL